MTSVITKVWCPFCHGWLLVRTEHGGNVPDRNVSSPLEERIDLSKVMSGNTVLTSGGDKGGRVSDLGLDVKESKPSCSCGKVFAVEITFTRTVLIHKLECDSFAIDGKAHAENQKKKKEVEAKESHDES